VISPPPRAARNGLPESPAYEWRGRRYPWALAVLAAAEAVHGPPSPTCLCGQPVPGGTSIRRCPACGRSPAEESGWTA
jgi:hypothetical protein